MTLDPRWGIIISFILGALSFLAGAGSTLTDTGLDPVTVKHVLAWITILVGIGNIGLGVVVGIPSKDNRTGFIIKGPPPAP